MATDGTVIKFNNGVCAPQLGIGTWQSSSELVGAAVKTAIDCGYRHIDCAFIYQNEEVIGSAIQEKINEGKVKREDLFVVTKLWCTFHSKEKVREGFEASLRALKLTYLDLYLIHAPFGFAEDTGELLPKDENGIVRGSDVDYVETWLAMEELVKSGVVRCIGLSNFNAAQTQRILDCCSILPVTNQVECHPLLNNEKLRLFHEKKGITLTAYSPLGSPGSDARSFKTNLLEHDLVTSLATKYSKSPAQVLIRFAIQRGILVIPKSTNERRIRENIDVFDFVLSAEEVEQLLEMNLPNGEGRFLRFETWRHHKFFPFDDEF